MVGLKRLKRLTGRLSWAAGIVPRMRWAVAILYATAAAAERDARNLNVQAEDSLSSSPGINY
eukprot:10549941-Lingulodinium_polyedra.AAC.1